MCGGRPKVIQQDPEGDAKKAADKAMAETNQKKAMRRNTSALGQALPDMNAPRTKLGGG